MYYHRLYPILLAHLSHEHGTLLCKGFFSNTILNCICRKAIIMSKEIHKNKIYKL